MTDERPTERKGFIKLAQRIANYSHHMDAACPFCGTTLADGRSDGDCPNGDCIKHEARALLRELEADHD